MISLISYNCLRAQLPDTVKVLIVIAHPDDEAAFAATVYKITHDLHGKVDLCLITNGEGGYKYSTLAEDYYNLELTDEKVGRENLPRIRKSELMNAGKIIGIRNYFFLDQKDSHYGLDERDPLDTSWDVALIQKRLTQILTQTRYNFVFCLLPVPGTHAHHKAATILALRSVKQMKDAIKPIVLGCTTSSKTDTAKTVFSQLKTYDETKVIQDTLFTFDRTVKFGYKNALDYKIIVNWEIAEHKSQGTVQTLMNQGDIENFWYFEQNERSGLSVCNSLFDKLKVIPYKVKTY